MVTAISNFDQRTEIAVPAACSAVKCKYGNNRLCQRQCHIDKCFPLRSAIDIGRIVQILGNAGTKILFRDGKVIITDANTNDLGQRVIDQSQILDQDVLRDQTAADIHRQEEEN